MNLDCLALYECELSQQSYHYVNITVCVCVCMRIAEEEAGLRGEGGEDAACSGAAPGGL